MTWDGLTPNAFWYDEHRLLFNRDSRSMSELPNESVQMVCCSPPYWGLRKYAGLPDLIWGGDEKCEHRWGNQLPFCSLCGAWKGAYGLEPTPEMYVQHTIEILREVRRVLRKDGVVFLNIGDSYSGSGQDSGKKEGQKRSGGTGIDTRSVDIVGVGEPVTRAKHPILKPKDLCLIPFRVAIEAQRDGWWVRSVIIWNKPNPMPESVTDRPTESHEYILMLTKSARYYYDQEAVRSPYSEATLPRMMRGVGNHKYVGVPEAAGGGAGNQPRENIRRDFEAWQYEGQDTKDYESAGVQSPSDTKRRIIEAIKKQESGANLKSVWTINTQPYKFAHFATYPEKLVELCVKAATPEVGCCSRCGKPWVRIIKPTEEYEKLLGTWTPDTDADPELRAEIGFQAHGKKVATTAQYQTIGWKAQCACEAPTVPSICLDPFAGSGTTLKVAAELNRRAIGYELSGDYCKLAVDRNKQAVLV